MESNLDEYLLALSSVKGLSTVQIEQLIAQFKNAKADFAAKIAEIERLTSLSPALTTRIGKATEDLSKFRKELDKLHNRNIKVLSFEDSDYPAQLKTIRHAPPVLCQVGELKEINGLCVSIVGTREPTMEAIDLTLTLATTLAHEGFTVVSGLALGIDTCAHIGALEGSGKTIAVLGTDVSTVYPPKNRKLAAKIKKQGCLLSEHPFRTSPSPRNLVRRNRIISGLSLATIVIEARKKSGTLHTARFAKDQERPLFACQWDKDRGREGTRTLIEKGALPFASDEIDKVIEALQPPEQLETDTRQLLMNI